MNPKKTNLKLDRPSVIVPAFTVIRTKGGWSFVKLTVDQDFNILTSEVSNPDVKSVITEKFRVEVGKYWNKIDEQVVFPG